MASIGRALRKNLKVQPSNVKEAVAQLLHLVEEAQHLADITEYFHDQLAASTEFMQAGEPRDHAGLRSVCRAIVKNVVPGAADESPGMSLLYLSTFGLWHGGLLWPNGGMGTLLYFEAINRGLVTYAQSLGQNETHFLRFSVPERLPEDLDVTSSSLESFVRRPRGGYQPV